MASRIRIVSTGSRAALSRALPASASRPTARSFQSTSRRLADAAAPLPARRPIGAFRGGLLGFFFGSTLAGSAVYYYVYQEYKTSNELLTEDIYALQNATERVNKYLTTLEEKMDTLERKKK